MINTVVSNSQWLNFEWIVTFDSFFSWLYIECVVFVSFLIDWSGIRFSHGFSGLLIQRNDSAELAKFVTTNWRLLPVNIKQQAEQ